MHKILAITDIHMRSMGQKIIGLDPYVQFQDALKHAIQHQSDAEHVVLMGDLTNSGKPQEFERIAEILADCPLPYTLMAGNHDNRDNLVAAFPDVCRTSEGHLQNSIDLGQDRIITLDTLDGPPFRNDYHIGHLCQSRLDWLETQLAASKDKRISLFTHHPVCRVGIEGIDDIRLGNADDLFDLIGQYNNIAHIFSGHVHRTISGATRGQGFALFKSVCHQTPLIMRGGHASMSVPEPSGYGVILFLQNAIVAHTEDFQFAIHDKTLQTEAMPE